NHHYSEVSAELMFGNRCGHSLVVHSPQCVGRKSIHLLLSALTHPARTRRQGKATARTPVSSMTAGYRWQSKGAVDITIHIMSHKDVGQRPCGAVRTSRWVPRVTAGFRPN